MRNEERSVSGHGFGFWGGRPWERVKGKMCLMVWLLGKTHQVFLGSNHLSYYNPFISLFTRLSGWKRIRMLDLINMHLMKVGH